jgi:hypothetical protein
MVVIVRRALRAIRSMRNPTTLLPVCTRTSASVATLRAKQRESYNPKKASVSYEMAAWNATMAMQRRAGMAPLSNNPVLTTSSPWPPS